MSARSKRTQSSARPGDIVNAAKQKRRSTQEKAADELREKQAKIAEANAAIETHQAGVQRVADKEEALRCEDEHARKNSARPDLITAEVKRKMAMEATGASEAGPDENHELSEMDEDDNEYEPPADEHSEDDSAHDISDDHEAVAAFLKSRQAKKKAGKAAKAPKAALRAEINDAGGFTIPAEVSLKRKPSSQVASQSIEVQPKKSKTVLGGKVKGWKSIIAPKASKAPQSTVTARGRADSNASMPSLVVVSLPIGEFGNEESQASLLAARGSKSANVIADATAKMGISLVAKDVQLKVDGKVKREPKPQFTNAHLPFPNNSHSKDLQFWQAAFIVEMYSWGARKQDIFAINSHPDFKDLVTELWNLHFGAYPINDAVYAQAAAAFCNYRSKMGKTGIKNVHDAVNSDDLPTIEDRAEWVRDKLFDSNFVYENEEEMTGAYRGELLLRTFAAHLGAVKNCDVFYGHPVGALATACAATERALHMYKTGTCSTDGVKGKGKRSAASFVAVPWAARVKAYLPGIMKLSDQKWAKIIALATPFIDNATQITADDTEGDESEDSRGLIVISDDSADEGAVQLK
ncbi:hypothetical protein DFH09DRAFT_1412199 [Mycena vulgaris]|nr:hypothetical protein DFH09DRAFT_1412199 [Mycena vulgaris]